MGFLNKIFKGSGKDNSSTSWQSIKLRLEKEKRSVRPDMSKEEISEATNNFFKEFGSFYTDVLNQATEYSPEIEKKDFEVILKNVSSSDSIVKIGNDEYVDRGDYFEQVNPSFKELPIDRSIQDKMPGLRTPPSKDLLWAWKVYKFLLENRGRVPGVLNYYLKILGSDFSFDNTEQDIILLQAMLESLFNFSFDEELSSSISILMGVQMVNVLLNISDTKVGLVSILLFPQVVSLMDGGMLNIVSIYNKVLFEEGRDEIKKPLLMFDLLKKGKMP